MSEVIRSYKDIGVRTGREGWRENSLETWILAEFEQTGPIVCSHALVTEAVGYQSAATMWFLHFLFVVSL